LSGLFAFVPKIGLHRVEGDDVGIKKDDRQNRPEALFDESICFVCKFIHNSY